MTDYTKATGSTGTMMIRDNGVGVEMWLKAGSQTFNHQLKWAYVVNGYTSPWLTYDFKSGGSWQRLGAWSTVSPTQTVTFKLGDSGTSGLGGPTNFSVVIDRAKVPGAPTPVRLSSIGPTSMVAKFDNFNNGGAAFDAHQLAYGLNIAGGSTATYISSSGTSTVSGLLPGRIYYFWARSHNRVGWGPFSARSQATTLNVPAAPSTVVITNIKPTELDASFTPNGNGGSPIIEYELAYRKTLADSPGATTYLPSDGSTHITGLIPGTNYYFWARARNAVGWSAWSVTPGSIMTIPGARVRVGGVWETAVPYVRSGGIWKIARPLVRVAGVWKETS